MRASNMPNYFEWNPATYGLDVPEMDAEHQVLIGYMNRLHDLHLAHASKPELLAAVDTLVKYTVKHFADEEAYMARVGHPELVSHAAIHKRLLEKVSAHVEATRATGKLTDEFFAFLKMWLKAHICGIDAKYGRRSKVA